MDLFANAAPELARQAVEGLELGEDRSGITHLIVTTCTGFSAPGIDLEHHRPLRASTLDRADDHRLHGLLCRDQRAEAGAPYRPLRTPARVLAVNIELCTLHLKETTDLERLLTFMLWGDGCAAALVSAPNPPASRSTASMPSSTATVAS